jgi:hypothetical protein
MYGLTLHVKTNIPSQIKLLSYTKESVITFELQLVLNVTADWQVCVKIYASAYTLSWECQSDY